MKSSKDCSWVLRSNSCNKWDSSREVGFLAKFMCPDSCSFGTELDDLCPEEAFDYMALIAAVDIINNGLYDEKYIDCDFSDSSVKIQYTHQSNDVAGWPWSTTYAADANGDIRVDDVIFWDFTPEQSTACMALISNACALIE